MVYIKQPKATLGKKSLGSLPPSGIAIDARNGVHDGMMVVTHSGNQALNWKPSIQWRTDLFTTVQSIFAVWSDLATAQNLFAQTDKWMIKLL